MLDGDDNSLDDVAASILIKPTAKEEPAKAKPVEQSATIVKEEGENNEVVSEEAEELNEGQAEEGESEEAVEEDTPEEDEDDVELDEIEIDVTVDGKEEKVKLKDLKANYSGEKVIEKRLQEASEARTYAVHHGQQLYTALEAQAVRLSQIDDILKKVAEPEINWEELKQKNLPRYLLERDRQREAGEKRALIQAEQERVQKQQAELTAMALETYTNDQARALISKIPEFSKAETAGPIMTKLARAAEAYGYTPQEVGAVLDHRAMLVLRDAMRYQEMVNNRKELKPAPGKTTLLRPSPSKAAASPASKAKKIQEAQLKRAQKTGKADDVAATLLVRKK